MTGSSAQDPNESFDVVTFDGRPTGIVKPRAAVHRDGDWHRSVHVWVAGTDELGPFLTFQRRSLAKDTWGGKLDATVGGHFRAGESLVETLREVEEEIGVSVDPSALRSIETRVNANDIEAGVQDHELQSVFLWLDNRPLVDFTPNPDELAALVRFRIEDLLTFFSGGAEAVEGIARTPGNGSVERVVVANDDLVDEPDGYFVRIASAALRAIRGEAQSAI